MRIEVVHPCVHHPAELSDTSVGGRHYCKSCRRAQMEAAGLVERHVQPRGCYLWRTGPERWSPLRGSAAAHWLAHELGIRSPLEIHRCLAGYTIQIKDLLRGRRELSSVPLRPGDLFVTLAEDHCGRIVALKRDPELGLRISIRHLDPRCPRVTVDDFYHHFQGEGRFFR